MPHTHYCHTCGQAVRCREDSKPIAGAHKSAIAHYCPRCGARLGTVYA